MKDIYKVKEADNVCFNCDNFCRSETSTIGFCFLKEKLKPNDEKSCKKFIKKEKNYG